MWASNTTLDDGSDFYVANRGDNTIVRMRQDGSIVAIRRVNVDPGPLNNASINGIAASSNGSKIYVTFTRPGGGAYRGGAEHREPYEFERFTYGSGSARR